MLLIQNIQSKVPIISFLSDSQITVSNATFRQVEGPIFLVKDSAFYAIDVLASNITHNSIFYPLFQFQQSNLKLENFEIKNIIRDNSNLEIFNMKSSSINITSFTAENFNNNIAEQEGGAIIIRNIDGYFEYNTFTDNQALKESGGALYLSQCEFFVIHNNFINNQALIKGGAIYYDLYSPSGLLNNNFLNNQAQYGQNYASYPFKLKLLNKDIQKRFLQQSYIVSLDENFVSGQKLSSSLLIGIYDQNDQLISNDNQSETLLTSSDLTMQVSQNNKIIAQNGIFEFSDMIFVAKPSYTTQIKFITTAVNSALYSQVTGNSFQDFEVNISFRECIEGEITQNNMCIECQKGTYSLKLHSISCEKCFNNGVCYGKNITGVLPGFWRSSNESTSTFPCPNEDSCLGGIESKCKIGFEGKLCSECSKNFNGTQYARQGANDCIECESLSIQILKLLGILLLISVYVVYLLVSILNNPKRNKPQTVLIRILTNYFHAIMIVKDFDMSWPDQVQKALQIFAFVSSYCQKLDEGKSYLKTDYSIECWTGDHSSLGLVIGLTYIFFWTLGFPIFVFLMLRKNSKNLNDENVTLQYGLFFVGLNDQAYYWEIVIVNIRKMIFIICATLLSSLNQEVKSEVQNNNNSLFVLFLAILFYNVYFLAYWLFNFSSILIRIHSKKLHKFKGLRFLSLMKLNDYESDLDQQQKLQETKLALMRGISLKFKNKAKNQLDDEFLENQNTIQKDDQSVRNSKRSLINSQISMFSSRQPRSILKKKRQNAQRASIDDKPQLKIQNGKEMVDSFVIDYITEAQSPKLKREGKKYLNKSNQNSSAKRLISQTDAYTERTPNSRFIKIQDFSNEFQNEFQLKLNKIQSDCLNDMQQINEQNNNLYISNKNKNYDETKIKKSAFYEISQVQKFQDLEEIFPSSQPADHQPLKIEQKQKHERQLKKKQITNMIQQLQDLQLQFNNITDDNEDQEEIKTQ
eukprot:403377218